MAEESEREGVKRAVANDLEPNNLALHWEDVEWTARLDVPMSRAQRAKVLPTYRAAVPPPIADMDFDLGYGVIAEAEDARAEITRFDAKLSALFPDAEFAPLSSVLLRTESASSSQIEDITTGARSLALAEVGHVTYGSNAALVAANVDAMNRALALAQEVTPESILYVHEALVRGQNQALPGEFRTEQVWIGGATPHFATFVPPRHERVRDAIEDMCAFTHRTDLPLLAHVAIAHAQFETIHPFNDGNGRTGRALVQSMLKGAGATTRTTLPVSAGLLGDTDSYFAALTDYRYGDPNPIVSRFSQASFVAVANGSALADDLRAAHDKWTDRLTAREGSAARRALPHLLSSPAITSAVLRERVGVSQPAADNAIRQLVDVNILAKASGVQRGIIYVAADVIGALDRFADRARRG